MTSTGTTTSEAVESTQELAEGYLNNLLENGGIKLYKYNEETGEYESDIEKYQAYLAAINELEIIGVKNAKQYVDAMQQKAMIQEIVEKMRADAEEEAALSARDLDSLSDDEQNRLNELSGRKNNKDYYIRDAEKQYGTKIQDRTLIDKQEKYSELYSLAEDYAEYKSEMEDKLRDFNDSVLATTGSNGYDEQISNLTNDADNLRSFLDSNKVPPSGLNATELRDALLTQIEKTREYEDVLAEINVLKKQREEDSEHRKELFNEMVDIAGDADIDLDGINLDAFSPDEYGDNSVFAQVYDKVMSGLDNANYDKLAEDLKTEIEGHLDGLGLEVDLDLNIDGIVLEELESGYGLLLTAEKEMNAGTGLSASTIKSLSEEDADYLKYLYEENGLIKLNTDLWRERTNLKVDDKLDVLENEISKLKEERAEIEKELEIAKANGDAQETAKLTSKIVENTKKLRSNEDQLERLRAIYNSYVDTVGKATAAQNSFTTSMSEVQKLQNGFDQLDKIYSDVFDKEDFDFSSILNNQNFADAFGDLGDVYIDFIKTVSNSPNDIAACQAAFDALADAYIWNSKALSGVTDETRDATVLMLKQMGVANAAAIVDQRLAYNKEILKYKTEDYKDATYEQILAEYKACEAGTALQQALAELAVEKYLVNENGIKTSSDIDQLIALANSANATASALERLQDVKSLIEKADAAKAKATNSFGIEKDMYRGFEAAYRDQIQSILNKGIDYNEIDPNRFKVDYTGGSSTSKAKSSSSSEDKIESFDWIEIAINRIEEAIDRLKTIATSAYKALKSKLGATLDEITKVNQEISLQQQAYNRYMQEANSVGLSSDLIEKVHSGDIDINKYDEDTRTLISDYQDWYGKATECSDAIDNLHESLASLYEDNFNSIKDDFDNQLELAQHLTNQYETGINMLEARGYLESTKYYAALQDATKSNIAILESELASLEKYFSDAMNSGEIEMYSESWYSMMSSINGVKEEIAEANVELAEYAKTMREIEWGYFDYTQERISQLTQEANFLIDLMSNGDLHTDKGQLTDKGMATMGLHGQNYNTYMEQADMYAKEILEIDEQLAKDPYNTELIERREELLGLQQDSILAAEDEKQAFVSLVEEGINLELESLKELIDAYTDSLDSAKDLYEYQRKIEDQAGNVASLQKQLSAYQNDLSEETRAKVQKLNVELAKAEEELAETEYEQYITDQKKLLSELYDEYEEILNQRLDNTDALIEDMITSVNDNSGLINETLITAADSVGYTMTQNMQNIWNGATNAIDGTISKYGDDFSTKFTAIQSVLSSIQANTATIVAASNKDAGETVDSAKSEVSPSAPTESVTPSAPTGSDVPPASSSTSPSNSENTITVGGRINANGAKIYRYPGDTCGQNQYFGNDPIYTVLDEKNDYVKVRYYKLSSGVTGWFKKSDIKAYKTGGLVDYTGLAKVDGTPGKPELMLNAGDTKNFLELTDLLRSLSSQSLSVGNLGFGSPTLSGITDISKVLSALRTKNGINMGTTVGDIEINIPIERVDDYNDFVTQLQRDGKFEKMILDMTVGRMNGGGSFEKNKYRW